MSRSTYTYTPDAYNACISALVDHVTPSNNVRVAAACHVVAFHKHVVRTVELKASVRPRIDRIILVSLNEIRVKGPGNMMHIDISIIFFLKKYIYVMVSWERHDLRTINLGATVTRQLVQVAFVAAGGRR